MKAKSTSIQCYQISAMAALWLKSMVDLYIACHQKMVVAM